MTQQLHTKYKPNKNTASVLQIIKETTLTALYIRPPHWAQSKCPLTTEWINKLWYIHTKEYIIIIIINRHINP